LKKKRLPGGEARARLYNRSRDHSHAKTTTGARRRVVVRLFLNAVTPKAHPRALSARARTDTSRHKKSALAYFSIFSRASPGNCSTLSKGSTDTVTVALPDLLHSTFFTVPVFRELPWKKEKKPLFLMAT